MLGKKKCRILREIRQKIASENDIPFVTEECRYKGDCKGTCPKCESELRYLEEQLEKRRAIGKKVTVSAVALGLIAGAGGCRNTTSGYMVEGDVPYTESTELGGAVAPDDTSDPQTTDARAELTGKYTLETETDEVLDGEIAAPDDLSETELEGDVVCEPESETAGADGNG